MITYGAGQLARVVGEWLVGLWTGAQSAESKVTELYARSFQSWCSLVMVLMVPERARITRECDVAPPARYLTPASSSPSVIPVAAKNASSEATRSSVVSTRDRSCPAASARSRSA